MTGNQSDELAEQQTRIGGLFPLLVQWYEFLKDFDLKLFFDICDPRFSCDGYRTALQEPGTSRPTTDNFVKAEYTVSSGAKLNKYFEPFRY